MRAIDELYTHLWINYILMDGIQCYQTGSLLWLKDWIKRRMKKRKVRR